MAMRSGPYLENLVLIKCGHGKIIVWLCKTVFAKILTTDYGDIVNICDAYELFHIVGVFIHIKFLWPYHIESTSFVRSLMLSNVELCQYLDG